MTTLIETASLFNEQLINFLEDVQKIYNDNDVETTISLIKDGVKFNAKLIIEQFILKVLPFKEKIYDKDEDFFLSMDLNKHIGGGQNELQKIMKFTKVWTTLSEDDKEIIFDYMKVLIHYTEEYFKLFTKK